MKSDKKNIIVILQWIQNLPRGNRGLTVIGLIVFIFYSSFVFNIQNDIILEMPQPVLMQICITLVIAFLTFAGIKKAAKLRIIRIQNSNITSCFWKASIGCMLILAVWMLAYYPGGIAVDTIVQWQQVETGRYNDWHPVLHTLLFLWLPSRVFHSIFFAIVIQCLYFSFSIGFLIAVLKRYGAPKWFYYSTFSFIMLNPVTGMLLMHPLKDVAFLILSILLIAQSICICFTKGGWLQSKRNMAAIVSVMVMATIMRHNAILLTIPLAVWIGYMNDRNTKKAWWVLAISVIAVIGVKMLLPVVLDYEKAGDRQAETLGFPMTILSSVVDKDSQKLTEEARDFLYRIAPQEDWTEYNQTGNWNAVKFKFNANPVVEEEGAKSVITYTIQAILNAPSTAFKAAARLTDMVWATEGDIEWQFQVAIADNDYQIEYKGIETLRNELENYTAMTKHSIFKYAFWYIGVMILIFLAAAISRLPYYHWKKSIIVLPLLIYDFGTMLLLSGNDFRYFYLNFVYLFPVLFILMSDETGEQESRTNEKRN